jgi:hypothetical protein
VNGFDAIGFQPRGIAQWAIGQFAQTGMVISQVSPRGCHAKLISPFG